MTKQHPKTRLILASESPRRQKLLSQFGTDFTVIAAGADESIDGETPPELYVTELAKRKAVSVADTLCTEGDSRSVIVIGADTIVVAGNGTILGKPSDDSDAGRMLSLLSGAWHEVYTGVCVIHAEAPAPPAQQRGEFDRAHRKERSGVECTRVKMRKLDESLILRYIDTGEPRDKAGAYAIQGYGSLLVERVEGCFYNVVGLPLAMLSEMLGELGYELL